MSCKLIPAAGFSVVSPVNLNHMVKVLSNKKKRDWNREINLPRFNCVRSVSICKGKHANSKYGRPDELIEDKFYRLNRIPPFLKRCLDVSQQCPRPQSSKKRPDKLSTDIQSEFIVASFEVCSYRDERVDVSPCDFPGEPDSKEERCGNDDIRCNMQSR